ncbi:2-dehydropantoate 2-reductase [Clostridium novyi]|uniref:2-dehydropantoate 2-reductase n=1 Tax=Clostridium novyi (strain NT) TaxID=386415 RepID=A0PXF0_CLONN|nr:2-dehydropantoate 2-reductase [Clostridium novyi]ABK61620.1 2-dehydropantoate 2-reductase [Clostridium novyi NT]KEH85552.1 2-dehydropantoate 2-reductase [Clostridium novyi A str. NCTC 538]KEH87803.1 2-dehydropantoate 2-reductase [Clostridium novyi A str. BKT29909]KEH95545.1 2-dehydropantoate 2-reductase [Clostridium novyi A str. GD211209]
MKISIVGAGAMGSRYGYMLHEGGNEVFLIDAWKEHVDIINKEGLTIEENGQFKKVKIPAMLPEDAHEVPDLVILFTKSMGLEPMLKAVKGILGKDTKVLCLLNGLGHNETLEKYIDTKNIFMGVTLWTANLKGPGHVLLSGDGNLEVQNIDQSMDSEVKKVCDVLNEAGLKAYYSEDVIFSIWRKACVNGTLNSCCTILDCNIKQFGELKEAPELIRNIIKEFADVATKYGVNLNVEQVAKGIEKIYDPSQAGEHYPSMHQDLIQKHRLTEIDYINGYVSRKGKEFNIDTKYNDLLTMLVHAKEQLLVK